METPCYEWVGIRRLYESIETELPSAMEDWEAEVSIGKTTVVGVYFGTRPRYGIALPPEGGDRYIVMGKPGHLAIGPYYPDATQSGYHDAVFTEIACLKPVAVPPELSGAFWSGESEACNQLIGAVEARRDEYVPVLDLVAGSIGLRYHPQLVRELINENLIAAKEPFPCVQTTTAGTEVVVPINLNLATLEHMKTFLNAIGTADDTEQVFAGNVLSWFMRAWDEREIVNRFVALFVPLEMVLNDFGVKNPPDVRMKQRTLRKLIKTHASKDRDELLTFLDELVLHLRPPLTARFEALAREAQMSGWEADIEAFKQFNKMRNELVHRGKRQVRLHIMDESIQSRDVLALEDLAERYVSYALFGDAFVYESPWRPPRQVT